MTFKTVDEMNRLSGCTVIEGSLAISLGLMEFSTTEVDHVPDLNVSFPQLREITDYLIVYESKDLPRLTHVFPNLTVIRGNQLVEVKPKYTSMTEKN